MISNACAICGSSKNFKVLYQANFSEKDLNIDVFSARTIPARCHYRIVKCKEDGLVRSHPIIPHPRLNELYKESEFNYEEELQNLTLTYFKALKPILAKVSKKDYLLEIGCGNGFLLKALYKMGYKNIFGVEPSLEAVIKADKDIQRKIKVTIFKPNLFKKSKFKLIFFFQTLDHIPNPKKFLKECHRLLAQGGFILAFNHNIDSLEVKLFRDKSPIIDIVHPFFYSPRTIKMLFEKYSFLPLRIYSPTNILSLRHLIWLLPIPKNIKNRLLRIGVLAKLKLSLKLGNICIEAQKIN